MIPQERQSWQAEGTKILSGNKVRLDAKLEYFANFRSAAISAFQLPHVKINMAYAK